MTDLPVALLASTAVAYAACAFRDWKWKDLMACAVAMGFALGAKHSAPVTDLVFSSQARSPAMGWFQPG